MQFIYPPLTWAFLLVLVPLMIHLINLMRQRRVKWAAMEFLLKSNQKHRRWIWLKQLLLLFLRMLVVAAIVAGAWRENRGTGTASSTSIARRHAETSPKAAAIAPMPACAWD